MVLNHTIDLSPMREREEGFRSAMAAAEGGSVSNEMAVSVTTGAFSIGSAGRSPTAAQTSNRRDRDGTSTSATESPAAPATSRALDSNGSSSLHRCAMCWPSK